MWSRRPGRRDDADLGTSMRLSRTARTDELTLKLIAFISSIPDRLGRGLAMHRPARLQGAPLKMRIQYRPQSRPLFPAPRKVNASRPCRSRGGRVVDLDAKDLRNAMASTPRKRPPNREIL